VTIAISKQMIGVSDGKTTNFQILRPIYRKDLKIVSHLAIFNMRQDERLRLFGSLEMGKPVAISAPGGILSDSCRNGETQPTALTSAVPPAGGRCHSFRA
jgi:hypothetical protein